MTLYQKSKIFLGGVITKEVWRTFLPSVMFSPVILPVSTLKWTFLELEGQFCKDWKICLFSYLGGFHLQLLVFLFIYQFNTDKSQFKKLHFSFLRSRVHSTRMTALVETTFWTPLLNYRTRATITRSWLETALKY